MRLVERSSVLARGRCRGQAAVEFALVIGMIVLLVMGLIDFGRGVAAYAAIAHGAREGARVALYASSSDAEVRATVHGQTTILPDLTDSNIGVSPAGSRGTGQIVKVEVAYTFYAITPIINRVLPSGGIQMVAAASSVVQ